MVERRFYTADVVGSTPTARTISSDGYRPDIDGLRAVAVIAVLLYHLDPSFLSGGFVGVDVFFVISGFLITRVILEDLSANRFSLSGFYARRIRRIFPSLLFVFVFAIIVGKLLLSESDCRDLANEAFFGSVFWSNIYELKQSGYFDQLSKLKPFLHLWSLGTEEQFYLFWPALIVLLRSRARLWSLFLIGLLSFFLGLYLVRVSRDAAFFLPFPRFWEFAIGCALSFRPMQDDRTHPVFAHIRSAAGLGLIVAAAVFFKSTMPFPGWLALFPTLGAALVISAGKGGWANRVLLSHRWAVFVGLISYPLYLWHWPLLYFSHILEVEKPIMFIQPLAVLLAFPAAWVSYRLIELPIRKLSIQRAAWTLLGASAVVSWALFESSWKTMTPRSPALELRPEEATACDLSYSSNYEGICSVDRRESPVNVVYGDSHAGVLFPGLLRTSRAGARWMLIAHASCPPVLEVQGLGERCRSLNERDLKFIAANPKIKMVMLVVASRIIDADSAVLLKSEKMKGILSPDIAFDGLSRSIQFLEANGKSVSFLVDNPAITSEPELCDPRYRKISMGSSSQCSIQRDRYDEITKNYRSLVTHLKRAFPKLTIFDFTDLFCDQESCSVVRDGLLFYKWSDHLSESGAEAVGRQVNNAMTY